MVMVTGYLRDFGLQSLAGLSPLIEFVPTSPGISGNDVLVDRPVVPATLQLNGRFDVELLPTAGIRPAMYYRIIVRWLDAAGGFVAYNEIPGVLNVTDEGGLIGPMLITQAGAPGLTWVGLDPPPSTGPYTSWLRMDPNNINDDDPTVGDYYEWG